MYKSKVIRLDAATVSLLSQVRDLQNAQIGDIMKKYDIPETSDCSFILAGLCLLKEKYLENGGIK